MFRQILLAAVVGMSGILVVAPAVLSQTVANASLSDHVAVQDDSIRPFHVHFSDEALTDLRQRIANTRWPDRETVTDASQGVQLGTMQKLAQYWETDYDWRKCEARL